MESMAVNGTNYGAQEKEVDGSQAPTSTTKICDGVIRAFAVATTLVATFVTGMAKETETVELQLVPTLPPLPVPVSAKSTYSSAFMYFVVANAIAAVYSATSLFWSGMRGKARSSLLLTMTAAFDVATVALLFSANGAAMTFAFLGKYGNKHVGWTKVCDVFRSFCMHAEIAIVFSFLASLAYVVLGFVCVVALHRKMYN